MQSAKITALKEHIKEWSWLYLHPYLGKAEYFWRNNIDICNVKCGCFLCQYHVDHGDSCGDRCLVSWGNGEAGGCLMHELGKWVLAINVDERRKYAKIIMKLGVKALVVEIKNSRK